MLILTRRPGEKIVITHAQSGEQMTMTFVGVGTNRVARLEFDADKTFLINREEVNDELLEKQRT